MQIDEDGNKPWLDLSLFYSFPREAVAAPFLKCWDQAGQGLEQTALAEGVPAMAGA